MSLEQRAVVALQARAAGANLAVDDLPAFDREHATDFVAIHDAFAHAFEHAYLTRYERTLMADWRALALLVQEHNPAGAFVLVDRAFSEPLLVAAGIEQPVLVLNWAGTLGASPRRGSLLTRGQQRLALKVAQQNRARSLTEAR